MFFALHLFGLGVTNSARCFFCKSCAMAVSVSTRSFNSRAKSKCRSILNAVVQWFSLFGGLSRARNSPTFLLFFCGLGLFVPALGLLPEVSKDWVLAAVRCGGPPLKSSRIPQLGRGRASAAKAAKSLEPAGCSCSHRAKGPAAAVPSSSAPSFPAWFPSAAISHRQRGTRATPWAEQGACSMKSVKSSSQA